jgi:glycosyltransferase involved in cell wall biosynthesis
MIQKRFKIGFISKEDPTDIMTFSGLHYHMFTALQMHIGEVVPFGPVKAGSETFFKISAKILSKLTGKLHRHTYFISLAKAYASLFKKRINEEKFDLLFSNLTIPEIAYLETDIPIIATADANFKLLHEYYGGHSNLSDSTINKAVFLETKAFSKVAALVYPSDWVSESTINDYQVPAEKVYTVLYGANMPGIPDEKEMDLILNHRLKNDKLRLLFVGKDWERKGGNVAVKTLERLKARNLEATLTIIGCEPPQSRRNEAMTVIPFLDKQKPDELERFLNFYRSSHIFFVPSRQECSGMVFFEASAFGMPSIATDTGGLKSSVFNDLNGYLLPERSQPEDYAAKIADIWLDKNKYRQLSRSSRKLYQEKLNWDAWAESLKPIIAKVME